MREVRLHPPMIRDLGSAMKSRLNVPGIRLASSTKNSSRSKNIIVMFTTQTSSEVMFPQKQLRKDWRKKPKTGCTLSTAVLLYT